MNLENVGLEFGQEALRALALDWVNNFLTIECFASYHGLTIEDAKVIIDMGKHYQNQHAELMK